MPGVLIEAVQMMAQAPPSTPAGNPDPAPGVAFAVPDSLDPASRILRRELLRVAGAHADPDFDAWITMLLLHTQEGRLFLSCSRSAFAEGLTAALSDTLPDPDALAVRLLARIEDGAWESVLGRVPPGVDWRSAPYTPFLLVPGTPAPRIYPQVHYECESRLWTALRAFACRTLIDTGAEDAVSARVARIAASSEPAPDPDQIRAAETACRAPVSLIAGGPGTGKTTVLALILRARLDEGVEPEDLILAAPTGRAANRMGEAIRACLPPEVAEAVSVRTLHRLLEYQPSKGTFGRGASIPLRGRHILVDEASMIDLPLMAHLVEALPPDGALTLLGDPGQLPAVGVGTVFADLVARHSPPVDTAASPGMTTGQSSLFEEPEIPGGTGAPIASGTPTGSPELRADTVDGIELRILRQGHRNTGMLRAFSTASPEEAAELLCGATSGVESDASPLAWPEEEGAIVRIEPGSIRDWHDLVTAAAARHLGDPDAYLGRIEAFRRHPFPDQVTQTDALAALFAALERFRILTALARGATGAEATNAHLLSWWREQTGEGAAVPHGTPLMIRRNDYERRLFNGDIGILLASSDERRHVVFPDGSGFRWFPTSVSAEAVPAFALTIHKAQGSEYDHVLLGLHAGGTPHATRLLCREIVYTGITRARKTAVLCADTGTIRLAMRQSARDLQS